MKIAISPVPSFPRQATQLEIVSTTVELGKTATCVWQLLDQENEPCSVLNSSKLTSDQYAAWVGDDNYVARCVAENAGLAPA